MTIDQLIERLEEYRDSHGGDAEVRLMTQENWPFENEIKGLTSGQEIAEDVDDEEDTDDEEAQDGNEAVYIVEGAQLGYGSKMAWDAAY